MTTMKLMLGLAIVGVGATGCQKSVEAERKEAVEAAEQSEKAEDRSRRSRSEAIDEHNEYLAAVRREQLDYRARLYDELDEIDRKLNDLRVDIGRDDVVRYDEERADAAKVKELVDRRTLLRTDIDALESSTEKDWDAVRAKLDADLGDRPAPRSRM